VGREYGDRVPIAVTHLHGYGRSTQKRAHWPGQQIICFDYGCRLVYSKKRAMRAISFKDFRKRVRKNAKKGLYKPIPSAPKIKRDSVVEQTDTVIVRREPAQKPFAPQIPMLKQDSLITLSDLLFETNSYKLKDEHYPLLDSLSEFLVRYPTLFVSISGHTDNTGHERHNVSLSTDRANAVSDYLIARGVFFERIDFEGFGSSRSIATNDTAEGRSKNRRVEVLIKKP
jgi:outer membrane protein OmpA-like peptidoglycan-associated protein